MTEKNILVGKIQIISEWSYIIIALFARINLELLHCLHIIYKNSGFYHIYKAFKMVLSALIKAVIKDCLPNLLHGFRTKYFDKIS